MLKDIILENSRRKEIYDFIKKNPGFHFRELQRRLKIPLSSFEHHIDYMIRHKIISKEKDGGFTRFFAQDMSQEEKRLLSTLRNRRVQEIVLLLLTKNELKYQDLKNQLDVHSSSLSYYLKHLVDKNIILRQKIGYENVYSIVDRSVAKVLAIYKPKLIDKLTDKVMNTFLESYFKKDNLKEK
jgi:predicted transcriptional regulator